ncbi:MAG: hypothetical protein ABIZ05_10110 [Pseudonocardiaceae bacterium]
MSSDFGRFQRFGDSGELVERGLQVVNDLLGDHLRWLEVVAVLGIRVAQPGDEEYFAYKETYAKPLDKIIKN